MATTTENITQVFRRNGLAGTPDLTKLRKNLDKSVRSARKSVNRGIGNTDAYVHKHPWAAVGIAAGVVALAGIAMAVMVRRPRTTSSRIAMPEGIEEFLRAASSRLKEVRK